MSKPSEARKSEEDGQRRLQSDSRQADIALVHELCEPLTAIENYLEAAICLHNANTMAARIKLGEVCMKSQTEVARMNEILRQMRELGAA